jgi:two-component system response regulator (stage 0 sporulation protein F)
METIRNKILIVDHNPAIRLLYSDELSEEGYEVMTCGDGLELMNAIRKESPDLIVMDIRLERDNGLDLLQGLRDIHPNLPVLLCTAYPLFEHNMKSNAADYYVTKSSNLQELKSIIQMAIRGEDSAQTAKTRSRLREQERTPQEQNTISRSLARERSWARMTTSGLPVTNET